MDLRKFGLEISTNLLPRKVNFSHLKPKNIFNLFLQITVLCMFFSSLSGFTNFSLDTYYSQVDAKFLIWKF